MLAAWPFSQIGLGEASGLFTATRLCPREEAQCYQEENYSYRRRQPRKVFVAEAEARRQVQQSQANQQAVKTLNRRREEHRDEFYTLQHCHQAVEAMGSKIKAE